MLQEFFDNSDVELDKFEGCQGINTAGLVRRNDIVLEDPGAIEWKSTIYNFPKTKGIDIEDIIIRVRFTYVAGHLHYVSKTMMERPCETSFHRMFDGRTGQTSRRRRHNVSCFWSAALFTQVAGTLCKCSQQLAHVAASAARTYRCVKKLPRKEPAQ